MVLVSQRWVWGFSIAPETMMTSQIDWFEDQARRNLGGSTRHCVDGHTYLSVSFDGSKFRYTISGKITREDAAKFADKWWENYQQRWPTLSP